MFNGGLKKEALERLKSANDHYQASTEEVKDKAEKLYKLRKKSAKRVIAEAEAYINELANSPKEFKKSVRRLTLSFQRFEEVCQEIMAEADMVDTVSTSTAGAGAVAGVGVAALGPGAAMAIATTFGTASTGTAISALGGAAATNAALAWLGGGAMVAGGGGMAAGNALLALAGPVGIGIGGAALLGAGVWARHKNKKIAEEATDQAKEIKKSARALDSSLCEIKELHSLTNRHSSGAFGQLKHLRRSAPKNYRSFTSEQKAEIGALINNIRSLAELLVQNIK